MPYDFERGVFAALNASLTSPLNSLGCKFFHADEPDIHRHHPRVEYDCPLIDRYDGTGSSDNDDQPYAVFRLHVYSKRDRAFDRADPDTTNGQLGEIIDAINTALEGTTIASAASGWTYSKLEGPRVFAGPSTAEVVHRVMEYRVMGD